MGRELQRESFCDGHTRVWDELRREPAAERAIASKKLAGPGWIIVGECLKTWFILQFESAAEHAFTREELAGPGRSILGQCAKIGTIFQFGPASVCHTIFEKLVWSA